MVGIARTVSVDGDFLEVLQALREAKAGEVLMIDANMRGDPGEVGRVELRSRIVRRDCHIMVCKSFRGFRIYRSVPVTHKNASIILIGVPHVAIIWMNTTCINYMQCYS